MTTTKPIGSFALVLHTHLPWVAHHGSWPVGEEWLHQAFTGSWRRVLAMLDVLAAHGYQRVATFGVTPITAAMLDDPYCLSELHGWAGRWQLRAEELSARGDFATVAAHERAEAGRCLADIEARWLTGGLSGVLRPLIDAEVVELLGGPATHPFQPLLTGRLASAQLRTGLADARLRFGRRTTGIWAPECGYAPGLEELYQSLGIGHFVVDGPAVGDRTGTGLLVGDSDVACFARDRGLSYRIWSAREGYPAGPAYRDFHSFDHDSGFKPFRVTGLDVPAERKRPWDPADGRAAAHADALDFVRAVVARLAVLRNDSERPGLVVAAFDTELFGHWWYEGPDFLMAVLRLLPSAGVRLTTLAAAREQGLVSGRIELPASSWGAGQDWRVWNNERVSDLVADGDHLQKRLFAILDGLGGREEPAGRDGVLEQLAREALLLSSSDWAFMVTRDSAADYARDRARTHARRFHELADLIEAGDSEGATRLAAYLKTVDGPFGHLDVRGF